MSDWPPRLFLESELTRINALLAAGSVSLDLRCSQADLLHKMGRFEEAKEAYLSILKLDSTHLGALSNMGSLLHETNYRRAAITVYKRIIELCPGSSAAHVNLANVLWDHDDHAGARQHYEAALAIDPNCPEAHQGMAAAMMEVREEDAAWEHGQKGFAGRPSQIMPYHGSGSPVSVLVLNSVAGGNIPLRQAIDGNVFMATLLATEFHDPTAPLPEHQLVWNAIGDADRCPLALKKAVTLLKSTAAPVINPPEIVAKTGRADNAFRLTAIQGLVAPKTLLISRKNLEQPDLDAMLKAQGFQFPILLRAQGFHAGQHFVKIDQVDEFKAALSAIPGQEFVLIQFLDARSADGKFRKYRVMMINGKLYPLHAAVSNNWKVHYFSADMAENASHRAEDLAFLSDMAQILGPTAMAVLEQIQAILGLDYGGVDFGVTAAGEIIFFEANATMIITLPEAGEKWDYRRAPVQAVLDAVTTMLLFKIKSVVS